MSEPGSPGLGLPISPSHESPASCFRQQTYQHVNSYSYSFILRPYKYVFCKSGETTLFWRQLTPLSTSLPSCDRDRRFLNTLPRFSRRLRSQTTAESILFCAEGVLSTPYISHNTSFPVAERITSGCALTAMSGDSCTYNYNCLEHPEKVYPYPDITGIGVSLFPTSLEKTPTLLTTGLGHNRLCWDSRNCCGYNHRLLFPCISTRIGSISIWRWHG